ncbi:hypothetical protein RclHR1_06740002 [Rhizophagus clarus]|uniref:F-box domain-containing protein n=1 Tax=Rhizophagus clarus TaxID=94130 RepID=A0A2Z6RTH0_9GLOM|nr:hypothetical protein RclHR1_06740002 [Rhizophagus clarus]GET01029.1 hypothetical protein GLOIN_2v1593238 [Rhizophagus clarus]
MTSYLPAECLRQIFEELKDDKEDLHSCLLVNRHWCKNIIDILWKQPFRFLYTCKKESCQCNNEKAIKRQFQAYNLLETYLSCFMFNEEIKISSQRRQDRDRPNYNRPIFNYIQYLKYLDFEELHNAIIDWIQFASKNSKINNNNYISIGDFFSPILNWIGFPSTSLSFILSSSSNNDYSIMLFKYLSNNILNYKQPQNNDQLNDWVAIVICKLLMRNKENSLTSISIEVEMNELKSGKFRCKHLNKDYQYSYMDDDDDDDEQQSLDFVRLPESYFILPIFEGSSNCLSNLVEFICTSKQRKQILLNSLAKVSKNLKTIIISIEYDQYSWLDFNNNMLEEVNSLVNLIQVQNSLSHFEIYRCPIGFDLVILALKKHLHTLKLIRLVEVKIKNYEILNIINDTSRWEIMDLDVTETSQIYNTVFF